MTCGADFGSSDGREVMNSRTLARLDVIREGSNLRNRVIEALLCLSFYRLWEVWKVGEVGRKLGQEIRCAFVKYKGIG